MLELEQYSGTLGIMGMDCVRGRFAESLAQMVSYTQVELLRNGNLPMYIHKAPCTYHSLARNSLVEHMQGDWLFMTDTDHQFAPDMLVRLLRLSIKYNSDVISGMYCSKYPPHRIIAGIWTNDDKLAHPVVEWNKEKEILNLPGPVGGGCMLIKRGVFDRIKNELKELPFLEYNNYSEDYAFCHRCKRLGIPIHLAINVESHHLIDHAISLEDYIPPPKSEMVGI